MVASTNPKRDWENLFAIWSQPPSKAERERCSRAVEAIRSAVAEDAVLSSTRAVWAHPQGSYRNHTNVRQDSDVDVCVFRKDMIFCENLPANIAPQAIGLYPTNYTFTQYKNEVQRALVNKFGHNSVQRGNKAFNIKESVSRVDADATPCFEYRYYIANQLNPLYFHQGIGLINEKTDSLIFNFPEQQHANGVIKDNATQFRFKKTVRIIKKLRYEMKDEGYSSAGPIASFLIESLVWNIPNAQFSLPSLISSGSLYDMVQRILAYLWENTRDDSTCKGWTEENGIKFLFHNSQSWNRAQVNAFLYDAWNRIQNR